ncbi:septum formation initiator family protein [Caldibacillus lycopersici]|uniref:Septum formation initiator family protein n=1 Tax=Perspicuibacillus lycopersici TaxID=1325689 RepID=A0AAE3IVL8_9BACI|nr:septum formation initiator family protein [Perspicuibacillus lycopersici]MCU9615277.1 septum formation initiator family protein [Perspicuibacillus lycopersici]
MSMLSNRKIPIVNQSYNHQQQLQSMQASRKKKLLVRRLTMFFVFAAVFTVLLVKSFHNQEALLQSKQEQLKSLQTEYNDLVEKQSALQEEIIKLQDDEYIGKYARQEFFLSDDGEIIFSIPNEKDGQDAD